MVLYEITLVPMVEELQDAYPTLLSPFYADDAAFDGLERRSAAQIRLLMDQRQDRGYFPKPSKSLFMAENPKEKEAAKREFKQAGLNLNYVDCGSYLWVYLVPKEEL